MIKRMTRTLINVVRATLWIVAAAGLLIGVNWTAHDYNQRLDLTTLGTHTLGPKTLQILAHLDREIEIVALYPGVPPDRVKDLFSEFTRVTGGKVSTDIVDPLQNLAYAAQFSSKIDVSERRIIIQAGKRQEQLNTTKIPLDEARLAAAVYRVSTDPGKVYFLTGHKEYEWNGHEGQDPEGMGRFAASLEESNLTVDSLELATHGEIPEDCGVLVIAGARLQPDPEEVELIREYMENGGSVLLMVESAIRTPTGTFTELQKRMNPTWNDLLKHWGITVADDVVVDLSNHLGQDIGCPATSKYPDHDKVVAGLGITFYLRPRSIAYEKPKDKNLLYAPLVTTANAETSWGETDKTLYSHFDKGVDTPGPVTIASVMAQDPKDWKNGRGTKLIVIGDADFATNQFADRYSNLDLVVNSVSWLAQREVILPDKADLPPEARLQMTAKDIKLALLGLAAVPLLGLFLGLTVWLARRH